MQEVPDKVPLMNNIARLTKDKLINVPYLKIWASDNLMSCVSIRGSFTPKEDWKYDIYENSLFFLFHIVPARKGRWYNGKDRATVENVHTTYELKKIRKYTGPIDKVIEKISQWIDKQELIEGHISKV